MIRATGLLCGALLAATSAWAETKLQDGAQLAAAIKDAPPCCVIDARSKGARALHPLMEALVWRKGLEIKPTGPVVVIADTDQKALAVGRAIEKSSGAGRVLAVKGGFATWRRATAPEQGMPATFVIPRNTCEQGTPLQTLRSGSKKP